MKEYFSACLLAVLVFLVGFCVWQEAADAHSPQIREETLRAIRLCESGGDYQAVNVSDSEWHPQWKTQGSYGAYQLSQPIWDEQTGRNNRGAHPLSSWEGIRPDLAPPYIQDRVAESLYDDYHEAAEGIKVLWRHEGNC